YLNFADAQLPKRHAGLIPPDTEGGADRPATAPRPGHPEGEQGLVVDQGSPAGADARITRPGPCTLPAADGRVATKSGHRIGQVPHRHHRPTTSSGSARIVLDLVLEAATLPGEPDSPRWCDIALSINNIRWRPPRSSQRGRPGVREMPDTSRGF